MTFSIRHGLLVGCCALASVCCIGSARAVVIDNTTQGNWIQGGNHVYGGDGYILMNFKAIVPGEYVASGNSDGSVSDRVSLPSFVTSYSYNSTGLVGWYGANGPGDVNNANPAAGLQDPLDPNNPAAAKQTGSYAYVDGAGTSSISINFGPNVPQTFNLGLYGSMIERPGQAVDIDVLGETVTWEGPEYNDGIWSIFTIEGAVPNSTLIIDFDPDGVYAFISAVTFDTVLVPEPSSVTLAFMAGVGLLVAARRRRTIAQ